MFNINTNETKNNSRKLCRRNPFSHEEDVLLSAIVQKYGIQDWVFIASLMPNRNSRQCRERWFNYLSPSINTAEWTEEEDKLILEKYNEIGSKWVQMMKYFQNRTDIMLKNRYQVILRRQNRIRKDKDRKDTDALAQSPNKQIDESPILTQNEFNESFPKGLFEEDSLFEQIDDFGFDDNLTFWL